ncbi:MAG: VOC family protein [Methylobacterium mesophilicum]|nr:VOC family protein [Methylobacterium mesophilicum]
MNELPFAATTPIHVSRVALRARDADNLARFYERVVGLRELGRNNGAIRLGAGNTELLRIESDPSAEPDNSRAAGLFHTAFLLPERADLARWLRHAAQNRLPISGASDHLVSEAVYLDDPEGNGIEIYRDRRPDEWTWHGSQVEMATVRLDSENLFASLSQDDAGWQGAPDNTIVGHVHLRVGDPRQAESWWQDNLGFDTVARYGDAAAFMSTGGYHHHVGANAWQSRGAGPRDPKRAGLSWFELASREARESKSFPDPWGTEVRLAPSA